MTTGPEPITIDIAQHRARVAATCMANFDIRYYLQGIYVEPREAGGVFIVGTDGHRMMGVIDESGSASAPAIIRLNRDTVQKMAKPHFVDGGPRMSKSQAAAHYNRKDKDSPYLRLQTEQFRDKTALVLTDAANHAHHLQPDCIIEGKFPDWRRIMPDFKKLTKGCSAHYNVHLLAGPLAIFGEGRFGRNTATPYQADPNGVIVWHIPGHEYAAFLLMPMRDDGSGRVSVWNQNWSNDARRSAGPQAAAQSPVAVPAERAETASGEAGEAGAQPAADAQDQQPAG